MLLDLLWLAVPAYLIVQAVVLWRSAGRRRLVAGVPLIVMAPVLVLTIVGLIQNSNLWPLLLLLTSPVALVYVVIVAFTIHRPAPQPSTGTNVRPGTSAANA